MILSKQEIFKAIKRGKIKIEPFDINSLNSCSYDLSLGNEFAFPIKKTINIHPEVNFKDYFKTKILKELKLKPEDFILAITQEKITLADDIAGMLFGRSRFARLGLQAHASSSLVHPDVSNKQIFEIKNIGKSTLLIKPGLKIGQIVFFKIKGKCNYEGIFKNQENIIK